MIGGGTSEGNMAYGTVDLGFSAWRLFRYVRADYVRVYENSNKTASIFGAFSDVTTINSVYQEVKKNDK
ncbi:hypothetical protein PS718_02933 [Pseudomonas fluorescens]|uniref:Uncharacterized protein n=1 Tax=Pseudomonas fluorescens TaxID=294 RepID=A0A5E7CI72_PSEFL|nr:hypothetical protein [Pseudomonas fluorescens]VVO04487.1 hypothetical protein PS718_02933 [Pseudomonas fluorescens]